MSAILQPGVYFIQNAGTGTVIDLRESSPVDGTKTQGYTKRSLSDPAVPAQLWVVASINNTGAETIYTIQNATSRTYMDLSGSSADNGTPVIGFKRTGKPNQQWRIIQNTQKTAYVIQNVSTGTYVDLLDGGNANGTAVNGWAGSGASTTNNHQLWKFVQN